MTEEQTRDQEGRPDSAQALSRMKEQIEAIAQKQAEDRLQEAKDEAKKILEEAEQKAREIKVEILDAARSEAERTKIREISKKKQALKMEYLGSREAVIDEILTQAKSELQKFTKSKDYPGFLTELLKTSGISIGGGALELHLRKEDKAHFTKDTLDSVAKSISEETDQPTLINLASEELRALGGLKIVRSDNKVFVDNTFATRLERMNEDTRVALLEFLN